MHRPLLRLLICQPRGFCAGVDRAIQLVEVALARYGAPVYVRHEIVHNRYVVEDLKRKGAVFVESLDEVPDTVQPVIFSAHGVARSVVDKAERRGLNRLDATCPLVSKVHKEVILHVRRGRRVILVGHAGHPEVIGTMGQTPADTVVLVETVADVAALPPADPAGLAFATQTTLSVDDTADIVAALQTRFPGIHGPHKEDICYATTNRQEGVKAVAPHVERMIVVGAPNSSNSQRLREVAERAGAKKAVLVQRASDLDWADFAGVSSVGLTAGASAPEVLVEEVIDALAARFTLDIAFVRTAEENVVFHLPRELRGAA